MPIKFINRSVLPTEKLGKFLSSIYGLGRMSSMRICRQLGLSYAARIEELSESKIRYIEISFVKKDLGLDLQRKVQTKLADKIRLGGYSGLRLSQGLPSHGQRTKTNAQTCKKISRKNNEKFIKVESSSNRSRIKNEK
jgi:small subunit ribosomal protein S13